MQQIHKYFPDLSKDQYDQLNALGQLYAEWNEKINVISRKDIANIYEHHVLHSMSIGKLIHFRDNSRIMDLGSGGGFPGIPLAILFPNVMFHLVDSIGKKVRVAEGIARAVNLKNVEFSHSRGEDIKGNNYDFVVSRAVMPLGDILKCVKKNISKNSSNSLPNGIIALKGGDIEAEIASMRNRCTTWAISNWFSEEWFETKKIVHLAVK